MHAARVAARLRRELDVDVEMVRGHYGEFKVLLGDRVIVNGGVKVVLGIMPSSDTVLDAVRAGLRG